MNDDEAIAALDALSGRDPDHSHRQADYILLRASHIDVIAAYERLRVRADGFWYS